MSIMARGIKLLPQVLAGQGVTRRRSSNCCPVDRPAAIIGLAWGEFGRRAIRFRRVRFKLSKSMRRGLRRVLLYGITRSFSRRRIGPPVVAAELVPFRLCFATVFCKRNKFRCYGGRKVAIARLDPNVAKSKPAKFQFTVNHYKTSTHCLPPQLCYNCSRSSNHGISRTEP